MTEFRFLPPIKKVEPKGETTSGPRRTNRKSGPVTRPLNLDDPRNQAKFNIAQKIEDLRQEIRWLEKEYKTLAGTYSDPTIDPRQLNFPFAEKFVTVHGANRAQ